MALGVSGLADSYVLPGGPAWAFDATGAPPVHPNSMTAAFARLARRAGAKVRFHDLRDCSATQLIGAGIDTRTVAHRLGHADPSATLRASWWRRGGPLRRTLDEPVRPSRLVDGHSTMATPTSAGSRPPSSFHHRFRMCRDVLLTLDAGPSSGADLLHRSRSASLVARSYWWLGPMGNTGAGRPTWVPTCLFGPCEDKGWGSSDAYSDHRSRQRTPACRAFA